MQKKSIANFDFENKFWSSGINNVGGMDEVGRGSFAGPVVAACVGFCADTDIPSEIIIKDSKVLTQKVRNIAKTWVIQNSIFYGVGEANVTEINNFGIVEATNKAFRRAVKKAREESNISIDKLLIDAFFVPNLVGIPKRNQHPIIKGDQKSISIAAASILAKVYRDELMTSLSEKSMYKKYGWDKNKGYGTSDHTRAIKMHGVCNLHRTQFVETYLSRQNLKS